MKFPLLLAGCMLVIVSADLPNEEEIQEILDAHNNYRRSVGASNMEHMVRGCRQIMNYYKTCSNLSTVF